MPSKKSRQAKRQAELARERRRFWAFIAVGTLIGIMAMSLAASFLSSAN